MTRCLFLVNCGEYTSFTVSGHSSEFCGEGRDIVCAAVSSAVYLTANTVTDIIKADADIRMKDGYFSLKLKGNCKQASSGLLQGLARHLTALSAQYPENIQVKIIQTSISEVHDNA